MQPHNCARAVSRRVIAPSAAALHIHRSTLRYRLGRIADLTGSDLRDVDTRFNLHAATRVWRFSLLMRERGVLLPDHVQQFGSRTAHSAPTASRLGR